jgi:hypothetical protein
VFSTFIEKFIKECQERGMRIGYPGLRLTHRATDVSDVISRLADQEFEFVLALHSDFDKAVHGKLLPFIHLLSLHSIAIPLHFREPQASRASFPRRDPGHSQDDYAERGWQGPVADYGQHR